MEFTFNGIKTELKNRLSLLSDWANTLYFGVYERIIDLASYAAERLAYFAEFLYREAHWKYATKRESLMYKTDFISYKPHRKTGALGELWISSDMNFSTSNVYTGETVTIPKWHLFTNEDKDVEVYCCETSYYYKNTVGNHVIKVKQGTPKEFNYVAQGAANETIILYSDSIDNDEIDIYIVDVDGNILATVRKVGDTDEPEEMYFVDDLTNYYCEVKNSYNFSQVHIVFGNGINTRMLAAGERVLLRYVETKGDEGNIQNKGTITVMPEKLLDAYGNEVDLYVRNDDEISDGSDIESLESIRYNGRNLFLSGYRAGSEPDWLTIINSFSFVHKAVVWSIEDVGGSTLIDEQNSVFVTAISIDGTDLTSSQQEYIEDDLQGKKSVTEVIVWELLLKIYLKFVINGKITNLTFPVVEAKTIDALRAEYGVLNTDFGVGAYESNFIGIIDDVEEIRNHETLIYAVEADKPASLSTHVIYISVLSSEEGDPEKQIYIETDSPEIWLRLKKDGVWDDPLQIGSTSGTTITGMNGFTITSGTVSYVNNTVNYAINEILLNPATAGYQDWRFSAAKTGASATGLANDATIYGCQVEVDGGTAQDILVTGSAAQTITNLVSEINADLTGATCSFEDADDLIRITSDTTGESSTISISDGGASGQNADLFASLTDINPAPEEAVAGRDYEYGVRNPGEDADWGYIVDLIYRVVDGNGNQDNSVRLPENKYVITDIMDEYIETDFEYV